MTNWMSRAACRDHPILPMGAWDDFNRGRPGEMGHKAMVVCRFSCPVLKECREAFPAGSMIETIAAGGWFDRRGRLREANVNLFSVELTAVYLGVDDRYVTRHIGNNRGFTVVHREHGRAYFTRENVVGMSGRQRLSCGTEKAVLLHQLKGEWPCQRCRLVQQRNGYLVA